MVNYYRYPIIEQEGGGNSYPIIEQEGGGISYPIISQEGGRRARRRLAFTTRSGRKVTFSANSTKKRKAKTTKRPIKRRQRRRKGQKGKGFVANYLGNKLKDVGGQFARSVVSEGANEAQQLLRRGAQFVKNKLMNRRRRRNTPSAPNPVIIDEESAGYLM